MKCSRCNNEATTHLHQNINGQVTEAWLCSECAEKMGIGGMFGSFGGFGDFSSLGSFDSLLGSIFGGSSSARALPKQTRCSVCGSSFSDIAERGKVGCAECYDLFASQLRPTIERIHGRNTHAGKQPGKVTPDAQSKQNDKTEAAAGSKAETKETVASLRKELKKAVEHEEYEKAAQLRDRIRAMEGQK